MDMREEQPAATDDLPQQGEGPDLSTSAPQAFRALAPAYVVAERWGWWVLTAMVLFASIIPVTLLLSGKITGVARPIVAGAVVTVVCSLLWLSFVWPKRNYRHRRYSLGATGLEIHKGVLWRQQIHVPRNRVQHTDVSEGPILRHLGLATLKVYTAGSEHSSVELEGVTLQEAVHLRDELIHRGDHDAV